MGILRILSRITSSDSYDALDLLRQDHAAIAELVDHYERLDDSAQKQGLVERLIRALVVHARIEEELFYPALRHANVAHTAIAEAEVDHAIIRTLMADLNQSDADAPHFEAKVRSLADCMEEEEAQIFEEARDSNLNLVAIGAQLAAYQAALESRYALDTDGKELEAFLSAPTLVRSATSPAPTSRKPQRAARSLATRRGNAKLTRRTRSVSRLG